MIAWFQLLDQFAGLWCQLSSQQVMQILALKVVSWLLPSSTPRLVLSQARDYWSQASSCYSRLQLLALVHLQFGWSSLWTAWPSISRRDRGIACCLLLESRSCRLANRCIFPHGKEPTRWLMWIQLGREVKGRPSHMYWLESSCWPGLRESWTRTRRWRESRLESGRWRCSEWATRPVLRRIGTWSHHSRQRRWWNLVSSHS